MLPIWKDREPKTRRIRQALWAGALAACLLIAGVAHLLVTRNNAAAEAAAFAETRALSSYLTEQWNRYTQRLDVLQQIAGIVTRVQHSGAAPAVSMAELRRAVALAGPSVLQVAAIGLDGTVIWSTLPLPEGRIDLSEREHVRAILQNGRERFIGRPVIGRVSGQTTVQFTTAVHDENASLIGLTVVSVDVALASTLARALKISEGDVIAIHRDDGILLLSNRTPATGDANAATAKGFRAARTQEDATALEPSLFDDTPRIQTWRQASDGQTIGVVGLDPRARLAAMHAANAEIRWISAVLCIMVGFLALTTDRYLHRADAIQTERRRRRRAEEQQALLRGFADNMTDCIGLYDRNLTCLYISPSIRTFLSIEPARFIGATLGTVICSIGAATGPDGVAQWTGVIADMTAHGERRRTLRGSVTNAARTLWIETDIIRIDVTPDTPPGDLHVIIVTRDVTDRHEAKRRLLEAMANQNAMLRAGHAVLLRMRLAPDGTRAITVTTATNEPASDPETPPPTVLGFPLERIERPGFLISRLELDSQTLAENFAVACRRSGTTTEELRYLGMDGEWRWLRTIATLAADTPDGVEVLHYFTDITEEREARRSRTQVERLAMLGEVSASIAHEMRQPMSVISMASEMGLLRLEEPSEPAAIASEFNAILGQVDRVAKITDHIRSVSRLDLGAPEPVDLRAIITTALDLASDRITKSGVAPHIDVAPNLPQPTVNRTVLEQALMNVIVNACDAYREIPLKAQGGQATPPCPRTLTITAHAEGATAILRIADKAGGMPPEVLGRIFTPFFTTKPQGQGTGLGLSFCANALREMGGSITATSQYGGSTFELRLPLTAVQSSKAA